MSTDRLYVPRFNVMPDDDVRRFVNAVGTAHLVTVAADGTPDLTYLPVLWVDDRLVGHLARANSHRLRIGDGAPALAVVTGPDAYVSPSFYASKAEHSRVVPTWNYSAVHLRGTVRLHDDVDWLRSHVRHLTDRHEEGREPSWSVDDAPEKYVEGQLRAIVGVELVVGSVEAKAKLSQNRSAEDRAGVVEGLGDHPVAEAMRHSPTRVRTS